MTLSIEAYTHLIQNGNATPAVAAAVRDLPDGGTLLLGGRTLHLFPDGAPVATYFISNNDGGDTAISIVPRLRTPCADGFFHGKIQILNNRFVQSAPRILRAEQIAELVFRGNSFRCDPSLPVHPSVGDGICVQRCGTAEMEPLRNL